MNFDVVIVGGGMVGLATACGLVDSGLSIAVIEPNFPQQTTLPDHATLRASAINAASQRYFSQLGIWPQLKESGRTLQFDSIKVWEKQGIAKLSAHSKDYHYNNLGYIIENKLIQNSLYVHAKQQKNITFIPSCCIDLINHNSHSTLTLENQITVTAQLVIAADGANSWVRKKLAIPVIQRAYRHHALIATVETELPHNACAQQLFYPDGIIAFLPLWQPNQHCLVWSAKPDKALELKNSPSQHFTDQLTRLTEQQLGQCQLLSQRETYPLTARYARTFIKHRTVLIGDAAHTIHPLAGQGVNLGLQDSQLLVQTIKKQHQLGSDFGLTTTLREFQSKRQRETLIMLGAMQLIQDTFHGDGMVKKMIRGIGMNMINHTPLVKKKILQHAMGL